MKVNKTRDRELRHFRFDLSRIRRNWSREGRREKGGKLLYENQPVKAFNSLRFHENWGREIKNSYVVSSLTPISFSSSFKGNIKHKKQASRCNLIPLIKFSSLRSMYRSFWLWKGQQFRFSLTILSFTLCCRHNKQKNMWMFDKSRKLFISISNLVYFLFLSLFLSASKLSHQEQARPGWNALGWSSTIAGTSHRHASPRLSAPVRPSFVHVHIESLARVHRVAAWRRARRLLSGEAQQRAASNKHKVWYN